MPLRVCVIGAGVVGLSCASAICEEGSLGEVSVTVVSASLDETTTTSIGSAGLWKPNLVEGSTVQVNEWGRATFQHFQRLYYSEDAATAGVSMIEAFHLYRRDQSFEEPFWKDIVINYRLLHDSDLRQMNIPTEFSHGFSYTTMTAEQSLYLKFLKSKLMSKKVSFIERKVESIVDFISNAGSDYDVVINCCGLGAYNMIGDHRLYPIRGQVIRVHAPWMKSLWMFDTSYIIPNNSGVVLGGTADSGNWDDSAPSELTTRKIIDDIARVFPAMKSAPVVGLWCSFVSPFLLHLLAKCLGRVAACQGDRRST